jgi:hypothetical protein
MANKSDWNKTTIGNIIVIECLIKHFGSIPQSSFYRYVEEGIASSESETKNTTQEENSSGEEN